jgi:hypothetical protein
MKSLMYFLFLCSFLIILGCVTGTAEKKKDGCISGAPKYNELYSK